MGRHLKNANSLLWFVLAGVIILFGGIPSWAGAISPFNAGSFISSRLVSRIEKSAAGFYVLNQSSVIYGSPDGAAEMMLQSDIEQLTGLRLPIHSRTARIPANGIVIKTDAMGGVPAEGFSIKVKPSGVTIAGADARGSLYGVYALESRIVKSGNVWKTSCGTLQDWPDLRIRGMCLELQIPAIRDVSLMKRYLLALSRARCNAIILYHQPDQVDAWRRNIDDGGWTKAQIKEIAAYARWLNIDVWGGIVSHFDEKNFPSMNLFRESNQYNPFGNASYNILFSLYDEILDAYSPKTLLIGHDEITGLSLYADKYHTTPGDILADDVNKIHDWLAQKGVRTAMWGDMLLEYRVWGPLVGDTNSQTNKLMSGATHLAINRISKDVIILDWHYAEYMTPAEYRSIEYFSKSGFAVVGSPYYKAAASALMAKSVKSYGGAGLIGTDWGLDITLSPASTTLYTLLSGWSTAVKVDSDGDDIEALAQMIRPEIYEHVPERQIPVNLARYGNRSLKDITLGNGSGIFDSSSNIDLAGIPLGKSVMGGIAFMIKQANKNAMVVTQAPGSITPTIKMETINVGRRADAVAFLQTAYISKPQGGVVKVGEYAITYETGRKVSVPLWENYNITDIRSTEGLRSRPWTFTRKPDVLIGSTTGWRGSSATGIPLNLQTFIWRNPYHDEPIRSISLHVNDGDRTIKLVLIGVTLLYSDH